VSAGTEDTLPSRTTILSLARLVGDRVVVLHPPSGKGLSGQDVDCAVSDLDPSWPLRLERGWRLCRFLQHDICSWSWILQRDGVFLHLDTMADPRGFGRDGFPTTLIDDVNTIEASPGLQAAYLAVKRVRKLIREEAEWARIGRLAAEDWASFRSRLNVIAGSRLGQLLYDSVREGRALDDQQFRRARTLQLLRRFRTPSRAIMGLLLQTRRAIYRLTHPTGWVVLLVGADGSGKSTLARTLVEGLSEVFRREARFHWRPGLLPRPGGLLGRGEPDPTRPHSRPPHGPLLSCALLVYYWLDFFVGGWLNTWRFRLTTALVVTERGWWDLAVDPRRYRLNVPPGLVRVLGSLLPHPDMAFVLEAPTRLLRARKAELPEQELGRQQAAWREALPPAVPAIALDTSLPIDPLAQKAGRETLRLLEKRATSRLAAGWAEVRRRGDTRWWLPRGPREVAAKGLSIYNPVTIPGRAAWEAARLVARGGGFRLLPRGEAPPLAVREALAAQVPRRGMLAVGRANHPDRYLAAILDQEGSCRGIAKVATELGGIETLRKEAEAIELFGSSLSPPLSAPHILAKEPGLLILEAVASRPRLRSWRLEADVAKGLGLLFRSNVQEEGGIRGPAHGDCAPWNLLQTDHGWVLVDWEAATVDAPPFYDLFHYLIQGHTLLRRPSWNALLRGFFHGEGWVGDAVGAYAEGAEVPAAEAPGFLEAYLRTSRSRMEAAGERAGGKIRLRLLRQLAR
jgi:hypothetical protein